MARAHSRRSTRCPTAPEHLRHQLPLRRRRTTRPGHRRLRQGHQLGYDADGNRNLVSRARRCQARPGEPVEAQVTRTSYDGRGLTWKPIKAPRAALRTTEYAEHDLNGNLRRIVTPKGLNASGDPRIPTPGPTPTPTSQAATKHATVRAYDSDDLDHRRVLPWGGPRRPRPAPLGGGLGARRPQIAPRPPSARIRWAAGAPPNAPTRSSTATGSPRAPTRRYADPDPPNSRIYGQLVEYDYDKEGNQTLWKSKHAEEGSRGREVNRTFYDNGLLTPRRQRRCSMTRSATRALPRVLFFFNRNRSLSHIHRPQPRPPAGPRARGPRALPATICRARGARQRDMGLGQGHPFRYDAAGNQTTRRTDGRWNSWTEEYVDSDGGRDDTKTTTLSYDRLDRETEMRVTQGSDATGWSNAATGTAPARCARRPRLSRAPGTTSPRIAWRTAEAN